jgi:ABC-type transport system involved in multi-copper enzyme maturation permease subunit
MSLGALLAAEWTKARTLRSTFWTLLATVVVSAGLAYLIGLSFRSALPRMPADRRESFDPLFATFYSLTLGQLALVVFAVLLVGSEHSSGTIRSSLLAVPARGFYFTAKVLLGAAIALAVSAITVLAAFTAAQSGLGPHAVTFGGSAAAIAGAVLYLLLICLFTIGVTAMLRSSIGALAILLPILFLGSQGLGNIPKVKTVTQYLPDQAGMVMLHLTTPGDPQFGRDYGAWTGMGIMALWAAAALAGGYLILRRRDAA